MRKSIIQTITFSMALLALLAATSAATASSQGLPGLSFVDDDGHAIPTTTAASKSRAAPGGESPIRLFEQRRPLPELDFIDATGRKLTLADFRGKVVLLNIWATWCFPCRKEMPSLDRLQAAMGGADFQVLALSTDEDGLAAVKKFYDQTGIESLEIYLDQTGRVTGDLKIIGYPTTFLIDREGQAMGVKVGPAEWDSEEVKAMIRRQTGRG